MKKRNLWKILAMTLCLLTALCACSSGGGDARFEGWWVMPEEKKENGLPLVTVMRIFPDRGIWYSYDQFGDPGEEMPCEIEGDVLLLDLGLFTAEYRLEDGCLISEDSGEIHFQSSDEPEFLPVPDYYDGKWYKNGESTATEYYTFSGDTYTRSTLYDGDAIETEPAEWEPCNLQCIMGTGDSVKDVKTIDMGFMEPTFYMDDSGMIAYVEDMFDYVAFVHESMADSADAAHAVEKSKIMGRGYRAQPNENGEYRYLHFLPYGFDIYTYKADGNMKETEPFNGTWSGTWDLTEDGTILLHYLDGSEEQTKLDDGQITAMKTVFRDED